MEVRVKKYTLHFRRTIRTSRGVMNSRTIWYLLVKQEGLTGLGECAPLPGLSLDDNRELEFHLQGLEREPEKYLKKTVDLSPFPALEFALEMALKDLEGGGRRYLFQSPFTRDGVPLNINGLIWMGSYDSMLRQIEIKSGEGWRCLKLKIGALDFDQEVKLLEWIRSRFNRERLEVRVDANGAFNPENVMECLDRLAPFHLHSIEQPLPPGHWDFLAQICHQSPVPIALDEELISCLEQDQKELLLEKVRPHFLVLKPTLLGGFKRCDQWIWLAKERGIGWWITSALESNIGLNAIAQWTATKQVSQFQGLGTGQIYRNNIPSPLWVKKGELHFDRKKRWDLSPLGE